MILNNTPQNEAILSNVGAIGEFRIRNSAKAFSILSSGLYSNKIRAIIRELSCNAVDSHVAAGKESTPFDIHLPNSLEPWFSIRDYGTGLSHDQVTNIYTTYFESTKTDSNAFIGALGLGSKSPFSYTDNFTVTANKDGSKRIYTAFINEQGVPSIALMTDNDTDEPNGVEVQFSVNDRYDFNKFAQEAQFVFTYFKLRPVVSGSSGFKFTDINYADKDIIPGAHVAKTVYRSGSVAIMGNIAYPIDIPNSDKSFTDTLRNMLNCNLELHFGIGELDFQASREGLSYIPSTTEAIKRKLEAVSAQLSVRLGDEANKITNLWERATYVVKRYGDSLWTAAAMKYAADTKMPLLNFSSSGSYRYNYLHVFKFLDTDLISKYNMVIRAFSQTNGLRTARTIKPAKVNSTVLQTVTVNDQWSIDVSLSTMFVFNDTKVGALQRAKFHYKNTPNFEGLVYVIEPADRKNPIKKDLFLKDLMSPPDKQVAMASTMLAQERAAGLGQNVTILKLEERDASRGRWSTEKKMVWASCGKADQFDKEATYYYLPVKGFESQGIVSNAKAMYAHLRNSGVFDGTVYGVRKGDIEFIKTQKNWINLDKHVVAVLSKLGTENVMSLVKQSIGWGDFYKNGVTKHLSQVDSPYMGLFNAFKDVKAPKGGDYQRAVQFLCQVYKITTATKTDPTALVKKWQAVIDDLNKRYPLLKHLDGYRIDAKEVAEYITLVDKAQ
jgi:hypothetical protein